MQPHLVPQTIPQQAFLLGVLHFIHQNLIEELGPLKVVKFQHAGKVELEKDRPKAIR